MSSIQDCLQVNGFTRRKAEARKRNVGQALYERVEESVGLLAAELGAIVDQWETKLVERLEEPEDRTAGNLQALHERLNRRTGRLGEECNGIEQLDQVSIRVAHCETP